MKLREHLLVCLIEEAAEVQKAATKILRFGLRDEYDGQAPETNLENLRQELADLEAIRYVLDDSFPEDYAIDGGAVFAKVGKLETMIIYAKKAGTLHD